jgi:hypothetical protein
MSVFFYYAQLGTPPAIMLGQRCNMIAVVAGYVSLGADCAA